MSQEVSQNDILAKAAIDDALGVSLALPFVGLVIEDEMGLVAALAFNNYDRQSVDMTVVIVKAMEISAARAIAKYVFGRLRVKRVTCLTLATNTKAIERLKQLGFECEGVLKERFPQGDALIFGLLASSPMALRLSRGFSAVAS